VLSAVSLVSADRELQALDVSEVRFADLDDDTVAAYVAGGEWRGKAGGYAIQGSAQAFIAHVSGSFSGVMGLPLHATATLLAGFGLRPTLQAAA
jgi:septum formation protein